MSMFVPILAVVLRELRGLISSPVQVLTLIFGPLVIMILFGVGSNATASPPRAVVVLPQEQEQSRLLRDYQRQFEAYLRVVAYTQDEEAARAMLADGSVEAVVILPAAPFDTIASGEQATIRVLYDQIDPIWGLVVPNFTQVMASSLNREIFMQTVGAQQAELDLATAGLDQVIELLSLAADAAEIWDRAGTLTRIGEALLQLRPLEDILNRLGPQAAPLRDQVIALRERLEEGEQLIESAEIPENAGASSLSERLGLDRRLREVRELRAALARLTSVPPEVVISPLNVETSNLARLEPDLITFYAPSIVALLVQHVAVSMGVLAMVRERLAGTFDLYAVSPSTALHILLGKYLAYLFATLVVAAAVLLVLLVGLRVPVLGDPWRMVLSLVLLSLASVGLGLVLSLLASSERQGVQLAMLALLAVVFFSGFTLPLDALRQPALTVAYILPATYGVALLQDIMLRGTSGGASLFILAGIAFALFAMAVALLHWRLRPR